jgi:hypothetical protein
MPLPTLHNPSGCHGPNPRQSLKLLHRGSIHRHLGYLMLAILHLSHPLQTDRLDRQPHDPYRQQCSQRQAFFWGEKLLQNWRSKILFLHKDNFNVFCNKGAIKNTTYPDRWVLVPSTTTLMSRRVKTTTTSFTVPAAIQRCTADSANARALTSSDDAP